MTAHIGEIVDKKVRSSGVSLTKIAKYLNITRRTLYNWFDDPSLDYDKVIGIGEAIRYDFSIDIPEIKKWKERKIEQYKMYEPDLSKASEPMPNYGNSTINITINLDGSEKTMEKWIYYIEQINELIRAKTVNQEH